MVHSQKGDSWSRGLPASCVMIVRDDVHGVHQVPDHPVRRERLRRLREARLPLGEPRRLRLADALGHRARPPARLAVEPVLDLHEQRVEHQTGVADQRMVRPDVLGQVRGIERRVDELLSLRHRHAVVRRGEAAADPEDHVGVVQELAHRLRHRPPAGTERQRVRLGERALPLEARRDRALQELGEGSQPLPGLRVVHALPRVDDRPLGGHQHAGDLADRHRVGRPPASGAPARSRAAPAPPRS